MGNNVSFKNLLDQSLSTCDPFLAAACHPYANPQDRQSLERIVFATPKLKRRFSGVLYSPSSILDKLAMDSDKKIRLRVAKHPTTSPATLTNLAQMQTDEDLFALIASHLNTPRDILEKLYKQHPASTMVRRALCYNSHTPLQLLRHLAANAAIVDFKGIARNPEADDGLLRFCWETEDLYLQAEVAAHPNCTPDLRDSATQSPQPLIRRKLAQNPALPETVLIRLLGDTEAQVRAAALRQMSSPQMAKLDPKVIDPSYQVRRDQARHTGLTISWINRLARDSDSWVRRLIARHQAVPEQTLNCLADDIVMQVRRGVSRNPNCPANILQKLVRDPKSWVRAGVALREDIAELLIIELSGDDDIDVLSAVGKNSGTPQKILERIARHENRDVRRAIVLNRNAPSSVLRSLLEDPYPLNRILLAGHRKLVNSDTYCLLQDPEPTVRFAGAQALAARLH